MRKRGRILIIKELSKNKFSILNVRIEVYERIPGGKGREGDVYDFMLFFNPYIEILKLWNFPERNKNFQRKA